MKLRLEILLVAAGFGLAACSQKTATPAKIKPSTVEHIEGAEVSRVTLTEHAAQRLRIETVRVRSMNAGSRSRAVVPYASVLYDANGLTWVYTSPESLRFVRQQIQVDYIDGDDAVLTSGPPAGTAVVTVGALQLFGAEFEIGH